MRIAEVNDIASVASELVKGLQSRGHSATLIEPRLFGARLHWAIKPLISPIRALEWARLARRLKAEKYEVIHIHYAYLGFIGVLGNFPYILHCHGGDIRDITPFTRWVTSRALKDAGLVFVATPDLMPGVHKTRPDAQFLPNPIDTCAFKPHAPCRESRDVYIACALDDVKGASTILAACRQLARDRSDIRITAIAGGKYTAEFSALPNLTLLARQTRAALPAVIGSHGVVIGQVYLGAAGMAEFEAMACARPVIGHFEYGAAYPEDPPFVRARTASDIAEAVCRLVDDATLRGRVGEDSRGWVLRHHDLAHITLRVEQAAFELLRKARAEHCAVVS